MEVKMQPPRIEQDRATGATGGAVVNIYVD